MRIKQVTPAKQHLYEILLEDGQIYEIDKTIWEHGGLSVDSELTEQEWDCLIERSVTYRAREKALYYLSNRDYGSGELIQKLCRVGVERSLAQETVTRLCESGLIDDERYATMIARDYRERKLYPNRRIAMALREKGFSSEVISHVIDSLPDEEEQQIVAFLEKKHIEQIEDQKHRDKVLGMLARYGFSYASSSRVLSRLNETE